MKTGAIYSIYYSNYHLNQKVYAFILYGGPMSDKVHALNLGAIQLSLIDRYKLLRTIKQLISIPESSKYDGAILYQIFKQYNFAEIRKCYRTYKHEHIAASSLINFGLNKAEDFTPLELSMQNQPLFKQASVDYLVKMMNLYTGKAVAQNKVKASLATDKTADAASGTDSTQQSSATGMKTESADKDKTFVKQDTSTTKPNTATTKQTEPNTSTTKPNTYTPKQNTTNQTGTTNSTDNTGSTKKSGGNNKGGNGGIKGMY